MNISHLEKVYKREHNCNLNWNRSEIKKIQKENTNFCKYYYSTVALTATIGSLDTGDSCDSVYLLMTH